MKDRYMAFNEKTVALFFSKGWLSFLAGFFLLAGAPDWANAQCTLEIQSVEVDCNYSNGINEFTAQITVNWTGASGASLEVKAGGQSQVFTTTAAGGSHTFSGFSFPSPGLGYPVTAHFINDDACQDFSTADAIACTPACSDTPASLGGMAWKEATPDGVFDDEPGQPNIKVEAYDCDGQLQGTAFTNADGLWSITGLNAGEAYRVEFSARQVPGVSPSLAGPDNGSPVQFVTAGDCAVNAAFMAQSSAEDCYERENVGAPDCSGLANFLDWAAYTEGSNPFSIPPFSVNINDDAVFWARTMDGATPFAHKVYHTTYGGEEAYYLLEMEAGNNPAGNDDGVGVVFAFGRPVAELSFSLLDIDISGDAIDRVSVQGYLGGAPVALSNPEVTAGSAVSVLEPFLFEGAAAVDDASGAGNVAVRFNEPVDQLAITLFAVGAADAGSSTQNIGVGNISWCPAPAALSPECTRIFDWLAFPDNENTPTPYTIDDVELAVDTNDPFGIAAGSAFSVDNGFTPQGGQRGFWPIAMNASASGQFVESILTFSQPVGLLSFSILDIDRVNIDGLPSLSYQDRVTVRGFLNGEEAPLSLSDVTVGAGVLGGVAAILSPNEYLGNGRNANGASADGNLAVRFSQEVDSVVIRLAPGPDGPSNPGTQQIGLSDINFCVCAPAPLQAGDLVWEDENGNGVQEACEPPIAGFPVALYDEAGTLLATTQTNDEGRYHFTRSGTAGEDWLADGQLQPNTPYLIVLGSIGNNLSDDYVWINDEPYLLTTRHIGNGSNPFMNDSDPGNLTSGMPGTIPDRLPYIKFTTGGPGQVNTTLDAGFRAARFDLALRKVINEALTPPPFSPGDMVSFTITIYNQGAIPADSLKVVDFYPNDVLVLEDSNVNWVADNGIAHNQRFLPTIAPGDSLALEIAFRIQPSFTGDTIINRAEIYQAFNSIGVDDQDSSADLIPDNDAGGAPGSDADDAILGDGTGPVNGTAAATDEDDHDAALIVVDGAPAFDLALDLALSGDGPFYPGDDVTFLIEIINEGVLGATMVQLNNYIPSGLVLNDPNWTAANGVARLNAPIDALPAGSSVFRYITLRLAPGFSGSSIINVVEIASAANASGEIDGDSTPGNQDDSEDDQAAASVPVSPVFDLSLEKEVVSPGPFSPGSTITFRITVTNEGSVAARNVQITDYIPAGLTLNHNSWSVVNNEARLNNLIPNIAPGNTVTRQITFLIADDYPRTSIINSAEIQAAGNQQGLEDWDSTPDNSSTQEDDDDNVTVNVQQPTPVFDLALKKEVNYAETPGPFQPGDYISFNITVINEGNIKAENIQVADYLSDGAVLDDAGWIGYGDIAVIASPISSLEGGESETVTIRLKVEDGYSEEEFENNAEIYSVFNDYWMDDIDSNPDSGIGDNQDDEDVAVVTIEQEPLAFDLSLSKKVKTSATPGPFYPGSTVTFSIRVNNEGNIDADQIAIIDYIPPGLELADANWSQVFGTAVLNNPITGLAAGATASVDITFAIADNFTGTSLTNKAEINSAGNSYSMPDEDSSPANGQPGEDDWDDAVVQVVQTYDLALSKTINTTLTPGPYQPGGQVAFNLTIYNQGSLAANDINVYDYYPPALLPNDDEWQTVQGNILRLSSPISTLEPGQSATITVLFDISPDAMHGDSLVNCAELGSSANINGMPDVDSTPSNGSHDEDDDDTETIWITIPKRFDLALSKSVDILQTPAPFYPGSAVSYRITVKNEGDEPAGNIQIQDYIPQGLILTSSNWSALGSMAMLNSPIPTLLPGDSATVDISFAISPGFTGTTLSNYAEIAPSGDNSGSTDADSTPGNGSAGAGEDDYDGAAITVSRQDFDLALRKRLKASATPGPFVPGSTVTFEIEISNEADLIAQNIQLREYFPSGLLLADPNWNAVGNVAELALPIGSLAPGATTLVDVTFTVAPGFGGSTLTNYAEVGSAFNILGYDDMDSTPGNGSLGSDEDDYDDATIGVLQQEFDLALSKALKVSATPGPFFPGSLVTYRITVTNEGDLEAQNIQLRDYIPLGLALADNNWTLNGSMAVRNIGNLQPGASASFDISFTVSPAFTGSVLVNHAEIGAAANSMGLADKDSTPGNGAAAPGEDDYDNASISILQQEFDLALAKALNTSVTPGPFVPGSTVTYRLTITNEGDLAAQNIQLRDYIPLGLALADNNWTLNGSMAVRNIGNLQPGASATVNITFTIAPSFSGLSLVNFAEVGAASNVYSLADTDSTPGNGPAGPNEDDYDGVSVEVLQDEFDLALSKELNTSLTPGPFVPGSTVTYRLTVTNEGDIATQNVLLWDYIPLGLLLTDNNWSSNGNIASRTISNLAPGSSTTVNITFTIASNFSGTVIANYAEIGAADNIYGLDDRDSNPGNSSSGAGEDDFDGASIDVVQQPFDLALDKALKVSATPGPFYPGSTVTFRITVTNEGGIAAQNVQVRDYIPLGLILADNNWTLNGSMAYRTIGMLQPGASASVDITFTISPNFTGLFITNYGEIGAAANTIGLGDTDSTPANGSAGFNEDDFDSAGITVNPPQVFDLTLSKSVSPSTPGPYAAGSPVTFRLTVTNQGNVPAQNIQLWDYLPAGLTLTDNSWTANGGVASYNTPIASLSPGASQTVEADFVVSAGFGGTQVVNHAEIGAAFNGAGLNDTDSTPGNGAAGSNEDDYDGASIDISVPQVFDLALSKVVSPSTPGPYVEGSAVTFALTITNEGNVPAQAIQLWDYVPAGLTLTDNSWTANGGVASYNTPIASLLPGASQSIEIDFVVSAGFGGTQVVNHAEIGAAFNGAGLNDTDSTPGNGAAGSNEDDYDGASIDITVPQVFDLALSKSVRSSTPGPYFAGSLVTFRIRVTNEGNVEAQGIQLWDYLPVGLTLSDSDWTINGGVAVYNTPIASLAPGARQDVEIDFVVAPGFEGMEILNYAEVGAASNSVGLNDVDSTPGNGASAPGEDDYDDTSIDISTPQVFDLALSKSVRSSTPGPYFAGSLVTFRIRVTNEGNVEAQNIQLWDYLPVGLTLSDSDWTINGGVAVYNTPIASLAPGATQDVEIDFVVAPGFEGMEVLNYAEVGAASNSAGLNDVDSTPGNGASAPGEDDYDDTSIDISTLPVFDLSLSKTVSPSTPAPYIEGSAVAFVLTVTNQGNVEAQNIQLWDYLPLGLTLSDNNWTANGGVANYNNPIASLAPGASQSIEIDFVVEAGFAGTTVTNFAEIFSASNVQGLNDTDSTPGNGAAGSNEDDFDNASIVVSAVPRFDLALRKQLKTSATPGPFSPGSPVTYRITVRNQGNMDAYNVEVVDYIPSGLILNDGNWAPSGAMAMRTLPGPIPAGGTATLDISFLVDQSFAGNTIMNYAEISSADDDTDPGNTPPVDVDSQFDEDPSNDAGGLANSPSDDALDGDGTGQPGSNLAATDEDDQDPALIVIGDCPSAGTDGFIDFCLNCTTNSVTVDLAGALGGSPSPGGAWADLDGAGASLGDPSSVNLLGLPSGDYRFRYTVSGQSGCPDSYATVTVNLASNLDYGCNGSVNVPLGGRCEVLIVPDMILEGGSDGCVDGLIVNLLDPNGVSLGNVITVDQAQTLIAEVLDPFCGLVCWGYVNVQDFTPSAIDCPVQDIDLICSDLDSILNNPASLAITGTPLIYDTCVQHTVTFQDQVVMTPDCVDRQVNRVFTVTDPVGNSAQCTQVITVRNPTFDDLLPLPSLVEIPCDSSFTVDQNGNPHPSVTGYPFVQTYFGALPLDQTICSLGASYTDSAPIIVCDGTTRFIRRWDILDWCDGNGNNILQLTQSIVVGDVDGPVVSCPQNDINGDGLPDPLQFSTVPFDCTAAFQAPLPNVTDNCSGWEVRTEIVADEVVPVTNQYGIITGYDTVATILATILPGEPRFVSGIPVGCYRFRYKVTDDCNNYTVLECDFCVVDDVEPTAVCNDTLTLSIGGQGVGRVYAVDVNEGSTDNCGIDSLLVRRRFDVDPVSCDSVTPYYSDWAPYVNFNCCDVNQLVTIELLVVDFYGNENTCWMEVLVEDKVRPICYAPNDTTVSCNSLPPNFDPYDTSQLQALFGAATAEDGCGTAITVEQPPVVNLDQCEVGTIIRTFQAVDLAGNLSQSLCTQVVTIGQEFNYEIKFPKDVTTNCTVPTPDTLIYNSFGCDLLSVSVTDEVFTPLSGGTGPECYKIFRRYRVLNWCEYDGISDAVIIGRNEDCDGVTGDEDVWVVRRPDGAFVDRDNDPFNTIPAFGAKGTACDGTTNPTGYWRTASSVGLWEYTQIIKVMDTIPPQVNFTLPDPFCSYDTANCDGQVTYPFTIFENCSSSGLTLEVLLDAGADGVIDQDLTNTGALSGSYPDFTIQGVFPVGNHAFVVQASDGCGNNMASATLPFEVVDCAPPSFTCLNGLSFNLMPLPPDTDFDGDGDFDVAGAAIWANDFVLNAGDCSDDTLAYSINLVGQAPDINRQALYFTCEDTGTVAVQVYVWDSANNPYAVQPDGSVGGFNYGYCDTYITVQDDNAACGTGLMMAGLIAREDNVGVEGVEVALSGPMSLMMNTGVDGSYQFDSLETGYDYSIRPYLNTGHRNGISTFDLLIIQQHLLGVQPLDSPYKRIAADANRSNNVTTLDMIQIQQLILGDILEFPNNTSWRFVDKNFVFPVPTNPWFTLFPEVVNINDLAYAMMANDFVAVKIGDVNNSAMTTGLMRTQGRSFAGAVELEAPGLPVSKGEVVAVPITARNLESVRGCQFTLELGRQVLELADVEYGLADENSLGFHGLSDGYLTVSWYRKDGLDYKEGDPLFTLYLRAGADTHTGELLSISSRYTLAEGYTTGHELMDVTLSFNTDSSLDTPAFRLYQNRPNPFSQESVVGFDLPESGPAALTVFDLNGRLVYRQEGVFVKGYNELIINRSDLGASAPGGGVLYYRLQMGDRVAARKMIIFE